MKHKLLYSILGIFLIMACHSQQSGPFESVPASQFAYELKQAKQAQLLDVRTAEEFASQHIEGAINLDWNGSTFETEAQKLDASKPVFVYCLSGGRSKKAATKLTEMGFTKVVELSGGILKWNAAGFAEPNDKIVGMCSQEYEELIQANPKILINFYAEWCAPCKKMTPYVMQLQKELAGNIHLVRLNADEHKTLLKQLKIDELPTFIYLENQKEMWRQSGFISEADLRQKVK
jgi:thioredoxin